VRGCVVSGVQKTIGKAELRRFRPYPAYKESGVEWLGKIPAHWEVKRLKSIASVQLSNVDKKTAEGEEPVRLCNYVDVSYNERITANLDFMTASATPDQIRRFSLHAGDVLITKDSESWTDIAVPAVVAEDLPGVLCGYHLAHIRPDAGCHGPFLARAFSAIGPRDQFQTSANGITRFGLGSDGIRTGLFAMPPESEQHAVAAFLDREAAKLDALVAQKERLIALLQEERTALITRAVTKGLNPNAAMKDSGVDWLGEIPAYWIIEQLKWAITFQRGHDLPADEREDGVVPVVSSSGISSIHARAIAKAPGIVTGRYGTIGDFHLIMQDYWPLNTTLYSINMRGNDPRFLRYMLTHLSPLFLLNAVKSAVPGVDRNDIHPTSVAVPPLPDQQEIADFLDAKSMETDRLESKVQEAIDHLKEFRTTLISAAVTGKIDVREEAA
jgi:type I restriction enzyme S subunit